MLQVHLKPGKSMNFMVSLNSRLKRNFMRFRMLEWLLLWVNMDFKGLYETNYIWKYSVQLACIFIIQKAAFLSFK